METLNLKQILKMEDIKHGILVNLFTSEEEMEKAVLLTLESEKDNSISVETKRAGEMVDFENILHVDNEQHLYLLESRVFSVETEQMIEAYLEIFDVSGNKIQNRIDDVWSYVNWKIVN